MNKNMLREVFACAKEDKLDVAIELTLPERKEPEIIIVKNSNLEYKLDYYLNVYDEELKHRQNSMIKMISAYVVDYVPSYMHFN